MSLFIIKNESHIVQQYVNATLVCTAVVPLSIQPSISSIVEKSYITCKQMLQIQVDRCVIVQYYVPQFLLALQVYDSGSPIKRGEIVQVIDGASISSARARISMDRFGSIHLRIKNSRSLASWAAEIKFDNIFSGQKY